MVAQNFTWTDSACTSSIQWLLAWYDSDAELGFSLLRCFIAML